jgi:hypothetical protein
MSWANKNKLSLSLSPPEADPEESTGKKKLSCTSKPHNLPSLTFLSA